MNLLTQALEPCTMLYRTTTDDGYGGIKTTWTEGAVFNAAAVLDSSMQARMAKQQGVTALYTVTTGREINLQFHDVFRRERDQKIFGVTSNGDDKKTPASTRLNMRQVSAEEWEVPA